MSPFLAIDGDLVNRNSSLVVPLITSTVIALNFIAEFSCTHIVYCRAATKNVQSFVSQRHAPETSRKCQAGYELPLICQYVITFTSFQPYRSQRRTPSDENLQSSVELEVFFTRKQILLLTTNGFPLENGRLSVHGAEDQRFESGS